MTGGLVVNADDLGVSRGATLGILRAHREGIVTSASLTATTPFYEDAVASCVRACPELGVGLHFTLTAGRPVSPSLRVPLLIGKDGFFRWRFLPLLVAAGVRRQKDLLDQIEIELESQLDRLIGDGIRPDHIDGERHVHLIPAVFERVVAAARRHEIPFVRAGREIGGRLARMRDAPGLLLQGGVAKSSLLSTLSIRNRRRMGRAPRTADQFVSYLYSGRPDLFLRTLLQSSPDRGITEIMVHPGVPEESAALSLGNPELERYVASEDRRRELRTCIEARAWIGEWRLTSFRRLALEDSQQATARGIQK